MRIPIALTAAFAALATIPYAAQAQDAGATKVTVHQKAPYGKYLTDGSGRSLYMFTSDKNGRSTCYDACAAAWPPLTSSGHAAAAGGAAAGKVGMAPRKGGAQQVTYNGMPLYYFVRDHGAGSVAGEEVKGFGGTWYLVSPAGDKIEGD
ncbi:MAG TPA: hypothetical protein VFW75_15895 [Acetobacteraceae bacterium]|nr:hypothetical protein [Acetobacteraceae bacterium]